MGFNYLLSIYQKSILRIFKFKKYLLVTDSSVHNPSNGGTVFSFFNSRVFSQILHKLRTCATLVEFLNVHNISAILDLNYNAISS